jgi:hypothetical protein
MTGEEKRIRDVKSILIDKHCRLAGTRKCTKSGRWSQTELRLKFTLIGSSSDQTNQSCMSRSNVGINVWRYRPVS